ncbi:putative ribonuclease H-like domain-containing protein, partial [Tanacetum coccineum]
MRPLRYPVTILNTIDHLGKFDGKANEGFFVGYSLNSKAFRVFNSRTRIVEENLHIRFSESTPNVVGSGPDWLFDIDALTRTMNYKPIVAGIQSNSFAGTKASDNAGQARKETEPVKNYILLPLWPDDPPISQDPKSSQDDGSKPSSDDKKKVVEDPRKDSEINVVGGKTSIKLPDDPNMPGLEDISIFDLSRDNEYVGVEADINNLDTTIQVSPIPTTRIHKDHPLNQIIRDLQSATQTRNMSKNLEEHGFVSAIQHRTNHKDLQNYLCACFLSREEPKKTLVDLPNGKRAIGTKWVFKNKKDERGIMIRNKARLVAQRCTQEEGIDYDEVFAPVVRIEAIRLFIYYASFKDFVVYQMDVKSAFLYGKIKEEVYVCQPPGFEDPDFPDRVYKFMWMISSLVQKRRSYALKFESLMHEKCHQDCKHTNRTQKPLLKDEDGKEVDVHMYRSMIGSLMYLTSSRPDIMFVVCAVLDTKSNLNNLHSFMLCKGFFRYALMINPTIDTSCIEQFWATVKAKTINGKVQLQALVDGKKIIITESIVRRDLQLEDAEGVDCLPNATIFEQLTLMGYEKISQKLTFYKAFFSPQWKFLIHTILQCLSSKTTAWNEFSSTMASAIICLATNQKFNFSKYIFESMVKNLDNVSGNFLMYPRFVQVFVNQQLEGMPTHKRIYIAPSHTKKIFRNMRRVGKGFSGRETPLFQTMMVQDQKEVGEGLEMPTNPHHTPTIIQPSTSQPQNKQRSRRSKRKDIEVPQPSGPITNVADEAINKEMDDSLERAATTATSLDAEQDRSNINKTQSKATLNEPSSLGTSSGSGPRSQETMGNTIAQTRSENVSKLSNDLLLVRGNTLQSGKDRLKFQELMKLCTNLKNRVIDLEKTKTSQAQEITSLKRRVKRLEKKEGSITHGLKRLYKVGLSRRIESSDEEGLGKENASKQWRISDIDADAGINLVSTHFDANTDMFGVHDLVGDEVAVESKVVKAASTIPVSTATTTTTVITDDEITLAKALAELKSAKLPTTTVATTITAASTRPKAKGIVIHEQEQAPTPTVSLQQPSQLNVQDK